jgi:hypothetical protein
LTKNLGVAMKRLRIFLLIGFVFIETPLSSQENSNASFYIGAHWTYWFFEGLQDGYYTGLNSQAKYWDHLINPKTESLINHSKGLAIGFGTITANSFKPKAKTLPLAIIALAFMGDPIQNLTRQGITHRNIFHDESPSDFASGKLYSLNPYLRLGQFFLGTSMWYISNQIKSKPLRNWSNNWREPLLFLSYGLNGWIEGATQAFQQDGFHNPNLSIVTKKNLHWYFLPERFTALLGVDLGRGWQAPLGEKILITTSALLFRNYCGHLGASMVRRQKINPIRFIGLGLSAGIYFFSKEVLN